MTKFNSHKWIREFKSGTNTIAESPESDSTLKSLRIRVRGEEFPDLKVWWEYEPEDIMTYVYWHQKQLPPTGAKFDKEWASIVKQLHSRHPIPSNVRPGGEITEEGQATNPVKPFTLGDTWSSNFDYAGMLKAGVEAPEALFENIDHLNLLYESFTDVNYHREAKDLGNAIDWLQDANGEEDIAKAEGFLFRFRAACAKTLKDITRGK
jgi:hypothetical protein